MVGSDAYGCWTKNMGLETPQIIPFVHRVFHSKSSPSILGGFHTPYFWKHPYTSYISCFNMFQLHAMNRTWSWSTSSILPYSTSNSKGFCRARSPQVVIAKLSDIVTTLDASCITGTCHGRVCTIGTLNTAVCQLKLLDVASMGPWPRKTYKNSSFLKLYWD